MRFYEIAMTNMVRDCLDTFKSRDDVHGSTVQDASILRQSDDTLAHLILAKATRIAYGLNTDKQMDDIRDMVNFASILYDRLKSKKEE